MNRPDRDREAERAALPLGALEILERRSLERGNRRLRELLGEGTTVLDVGCGGGAMTRGMAEAVGPSGRVVGLDRDPELIAHARRRHGALGNLTFEVGDLREHRFAGEFDVVSAARVLQWTADPLAALRALVPAARPGGVVQVLDYDHLSARWDPPLRPSMQALYAAFLRWREDAGMPNDLAARLGDLLREAGLGEVRVTPQLEVARRGDPDFPEAARLWLDVAETRGHQIVGDGFLGEAERAAAARDQRAWIAEEGVSQTLVLVSAEGVRA